LEEAESFGKRFSKVRFAKLSRETVFLLGKEKFLYYMNLIIKIDNTATKIAFFKEKE